MNPPEEHPDDTAWYALTGPQRRLVTRFMGDLERGVDLMGQLNLSPVHSPSADYLMTTYRVTAEDAETVSDWFAQARRKDVMRDRVRGILGEGE